MIERQGSALRWIAGGAAILVAWLAIGAGIPFVAPPGRSYAVLGPPAGAVGIVTRAGGSLLSSNGLFTIARSPDPNFVWRLYGAGALLVLDAADAGGCSGKPPS